MISGNIRQLTWHIEIERVCFKQDITKFCLVSQKDAKKLELDFSKKRQILVYMAKRSKWDRFK